MEKRYHLQDGDIEEEEFLFWLTRAQLLQHFNDDAEIVDAVILRKETDPELRGKEIREHPECPGNSPKLSNLTYMGTCFVC